MKTINFTEGNLNKNQRKLLLTVSIGKKIKNENNSYSVSLSTIIVASYFHPVMQPTGQNEPGASSCHYRYGRAKTADRHGIA